MKTPNSTLQNSLSKKKTGSQSTNGTVRLMSFNIMCNNNNNPFEFQSDYANLNEGNIDNRIMKV